jgi:hypothetical protein
MFEDQEDLEADIKMLIDLGFRPPKWDYKTNVPISELTCSSRKFLVDIVCYREGVPILAIERDGIYHNEEKQKVNDVRKDHLLNTHGIRVWRWWNGDALKARNDAAKIFRRDVKAHMYSEYGLLKSDYKKVCGCSMVR